MFITWLFAAFVLIADNPLAVASQPIRFNYQAKLTDSTGGALIGGHTLYFGIYYGGSSNVADSGTLVYSESTAVDALQGVVNHVVGTGTVISGSLDDAALESDADYHLQVSVDAPSNVVLPRALLGAVPFAARARTADTAISALASNNGFLPGQLLFGTSAVAPAGFSATPIRLYNPWIQRSVIGVARSEVDLVAAGDRILSIGGYNAGEKTDVDAFDPANGIRFSTTSLQIARYYHRATTINDTVYVTGGLGAGNNPLTSTEYFLNNSTWAGRQPMQTARGVHAAAECNGLLYVFGGYTAGLVKTSTAEVYNPATNSWSYLFNLPAPLAGLGAATINNKIYVMGDGQTNLEYDTQTFIYTPRASMPFPNGQNKANPVAHDGKIYLSGSASPTGQMFIYDPVTDTWDVGPSNLVASTNPGVCIYNGTVYLGGGSIPSTITKLDRLESWTAPVFFGHLKD